MWIIVALIIIIIINNPTCITFDETALSFKQLIYFTIKFKCRQICSCESKNCEHHLNQILSSRGMLHYRYTPFSY